MKVVNLDDIYYMFYELGVAQPV